MVALKAGLGLNCVVFGSAFKDAALNWVAVKELNLSYHASPI